MTKWSLFIAAGLLVAVVAIVMGQALPARWTFAVLGALGVGLPVFVVRDRRLYGLSLMLLLFLFEADKGLNLTRNILNPTEIIETLGIPPSRSLAVILRPSDVVFACLLFGWALEILSRKERLWIPNLALLPIAYLGWVAVASLIKAPFLRLSAVEFLQQAKLFLLFVYVANVVRTDTVFKRLVQVLLFCLCLEGALTVAGVRFPIFRDPLSVIGSRTEQVELYTAFESGGGQRAIGTFYDYAVTAAYLMLLLPLALSQILLERRFVWKCVFLLIVVLGFTGIWLTYSRAGLLAAIVAVGVWVCLSWLRGFLSTRKMLVVVYAATVVLALASPRFLDFFLSRPTMTRARLPLLARGVTMTVDNPVFGVGLNNSTAVKRELFTPTSGTEDWSQPIHNYYLVVSSESGLVGFVLFFGFFFLVGREAFKLSEPARGRIGTTSLAITSAYVATSIPLLTQTISHIELAMVCFLAGLIVTARELSPAPPEDA